MKSLKYLELGYGQGLSINIHAAALDGEFWGTDFTQSRVGVAYPREIAQSAGSGVKAF